MSVARASETVRKKLEREINAGILRPGDSIDEKSLAARFEDTPWLVILALIILGVIVYFAVKCAYRRSNTSNISLPFGPWW